MKATCSIFILLSFLKKIFQRIKDLLSKTEIKIDPIKLASALSGVHKFC